MQRFMRWTGMAMVAASLVAAGVADVVTGTRLLAYPLYFLPLLIAAWYLARQGALLVALLATVTWAALHWLGGGDHGTAWTWAANVALQGFVFLLVTLLFARLRHSLRHERELSRTDPLTGLPNSRSFFERAGSVLAVCHRNSQPATLAYLDLDNFRQANDSVGHEAGDRLLRKVADVLNEQMRSSDLAARIGGDEFVMLLPETGETEAGIALEKIRSRLARGGDFQAADVTASIGAVAWSPAPPDLNRMIRAADKVMYRVKAAQKNHVIVQAAGL